MKSAPLRCGPIAPFLGTVLLLLIRATLHSEFFLSCGDAQSLDIILEPDHGEQLSAETASFYEQIQFGQFTGPMR